MTRPSKFLRLPPSDRRLLVSAALLHILIRGGLCVLRFTRLHRIVARLGKEGERPGDLHELDRIVWAVNVVGRTRPVAGTCLSQALTAQVLMRRRGYPAHLCIGVARPDGRTLQAHAWVEHEGRIVMGGPGSAQERYTRLPAFEGERP